MGQLLDDDAHTPPAVDRRVRALQWALQRANLEQREADHRIKNHLQLLASYARLAAQRPGVTPEMLANEIGVRLAVIARVHDALHATGETGIATAFPFLLGATDPFRQIGARIEVHCSDDVELEDWQLGPIGMFLSEAVTNSVKHARRDAATLRISVQMHARDGQAMLTVIDNGEGWKAAAVDGGSRLLDGFARLLGGRLHIGVGPDGGTAVSVAFLAASGTPLRPWRRTMTDIGSETGQTRDSAEL